MEVSGSEAGGLGLFESATISQDQACFQKTASQESKPNDQPVDYPTPFNYHL